MTGAEQRDRAGLRPKALQGLAKLAPRRLVGGGVALEQAILRLGSVRDPYRAGTARRLRRQ